MRTLGLFMIALAIASPMMASAAPLAPEIDAGSAAAASRCYPAVWWYSERGGRSRSRGTSTAY